jgi:hypothetical protein
MHRPASQAALWIGLAGALGILCALSIRSGGARACSCGLTTWSLSLNRVETTDPTIAHEPYWAERAVVHDAADLGFIGYNDGSISHLLLEK